MIDVLKDWHWFDSWGFAGWNIRRLNSSIYFDFLWLTLVEKEGLILTMERH